jgi:hypothetical protein
VQALVILEMLQKALARMDVIASQQSEHTSA